MLTNFTENVKEVLQNSHPGYILAFPHISYYYDMKLVTFGVDSSSSLVITFPIFIRPIHSVPLVLYEIEVIDVPVEDDDHTRDSYTKVQITKPYIAANENHYIQLQITELRMCKVIQKDYFCEELFMVKQTNMNTCESALFYDMHLSKIQNYCDFNIFLNKSVPPSVLDGGKKIALLNMDKNNLINCKNQMANSLPQSKYILTDSSILCSCSIMAENAFLPPDIGACISNSTPLTFEHNVNLPFLTSYNQMANLMGENNESWPLLDYLFSPSPSQETHFPITLNRSWGLTENIDTLREWISSFNATLVDRKKSLLNNSINISVEISKQLQEMTYMSVEQSRLTIILLVSTTFTLILYVIWLTIKLRKTTILTNSILMGSIPSVSATAAVKEVICQEPWVTYVFTAITIIGFIIFSIKWLRKCTTCRGHRFARILDVYLIICNNQRYVPILLRSFTGNIHKLELEHLVYSKNFTLNQNVVWDTLSIIWDDVVLRYNGNKISLPTSVLIPLIDKIRTRHIMQDKFDVMLLVKQGKEWKNLETEHYDAQPQYFPPELV